MTGDWQVCCKQPNLLGEGPLWSGRENAVFWVDILAPAVHRLSLFDSRFDTWPMPEMIGWIIEREEAPGFVAGLQSGFAKLTLDPFELCAIQDPEPQYPGNRMNDAKVDHLGRIWAGTMATNTELSRGSLYRLDTNMHVSRQDSGYRVTNGPAFSPGHDYLYHADTGRGIVYRFDMMPNGEISNRTEFLRFPGGWGFPDGMTVDEDGGIWIAHWGGGRISRFFPDATLDRHIELPATQITSCVFGGDDLDRMFVTSAAIDRSEEQYAGFLFEVDTGARGLPQPAFAG